MIVAHGSLNAIKHFQFDTLDIWTNGLIQSGVPLAVIRKMEGWEKYRNGTPICSSGTQPFNRAREANWLDFW